jgi:hypothetical protein
MLAADRLPLAVSASSKMAAPDPKEKKMSSLWLKQDLL